MKQSSCHLWKLCVRPVGLSRRRKQRWNTQAPAKQKFECLKQGPRSQDYSSPCASWSTMGIQRAQRASLALTLNYVAFALAVSAVTTSYWCEGTRKVVKPFCMGPVKVKQTYCIRFNSSNINDTRLVQYIYETGEEKFLMRKFHAGIWFSCEQTMDLLGKMALLAFSHGWIACKSL